MTIKEIKELLELFKTSDVGEMEVQRGENRVRLVKAGLVQEVIAGPTVVAAAVPASVPAAAATLPAAPPAPEPEEDLEIVRSPIVGTYYDSPSPDAPPFVKAGDGVENGQVLCIIESMKLMNEIESEVAGTIVAKLVENGKAVEYGEALFSVRKR